ncbi:MAG TPA: hypothetical protein VF017_07060 [Thermoanaerobaculia bacterium]|nr:hypothetical protein [Thermoanaerobaculia bacterium]
MSGSPLCSPAARSRFRTLLATLSLCVALNAEAAGTEPAPDPVSPGRPDTLALIATACPTFSWSLASGAEGYEIVVYAQDREATPRLQQRFPAGTSSYTPALEQCLEAGVGYGWAVRALGGKEEGEWSRPLFFQVAALPSAGEVAAALATLEEYLDAGGSLEQLRSDLAGGPRNEPRQPARAGRRGGLEAVAVGGVAAMRGESTETSGEVHGVAGITHSPDGAGLVAENLGGGPDLILGGTAADLEIDESGARASSPDPLTFAFENTGTGTISVTVDGTPVATTASNLWVLRSGDTMSGALDLAGNLVTNVGASGTGFSTGGGLQLGGPLTLANGEQLGNPVDHLFRFSDGLASLDLDLTGSPALRTMDSQQSLLLELGPLGPPTGSLEDGGALTLEGGKGQFTWGGSVPGARIVVGGANLTSVASCPPGSGSHCGGHVTISGGNGGTVGTSGAGNVILRGGVGTGGWADGHVLVPTSRLGVGTTAPATALHVTGQLTVVDGSQGAGRVLTSDAGGAASWQSPKVPVLAFHHELDRLPVSPEWTVTTTGLGQVVQTDPSYVRLDPGFGGPGSVDITSGVALAIGSGTLVFRGVVSAYRDGAVYGDRQPRGLAAGRDRTEAIEFLSASPTSVEMRTASGGGATSSFLPVDNVYRFHTYQIVAKASDVRFYVDGVLAAVHTTHIPSLPLNVYIGTDYAGSGTVPVDLDFVSLERIE